MDFNFVAPEYLIGMIAVLGVLLIINGITKAAGIGMVLTQITISILIYTIISWLLT